MSAIAGLLACGVSSLFFGSMFVPVRKHNSGNGNFSIKKYKHGGVKNSGIFVQWVMCSSILIVGLIVNM